MARRKVISLHNFCFYQSEIFLHVFLLDYDIMIRTQSFADPGCRCVANFHERSNNITPDDGC